MSNPHSGVRPAGAPMVPMARPGEDGPQSAAGQMAGQVADEARGAAQQVAADAREAGRSLAEGTRRRAVTEIDRRSAMAADQAKGAADDVRSVASHLREEDRDTAAGLAEDLAAQMERAGEYLRETSPEQIMADARDFARRQPMAVAVGAAVIGIAAGRVVKAAATAPAEEVRS